MLCNRKVKASDQNRYETKYSQPQIWECHRMIVKFHLLLNFQFQWLKWLLCFWPKMSVSTGVLVSYTVLIKLHCLYGLAAVFYFAQQGLDFTEYPEIIFLVEQL